MSYRYIYKITCTEGSFKNKFYFGKHKTNNLDDNYKGGGRKLGAYYKTYPNGYIKEIISFHDNDEELNKAEYDIIHPFLGQNDCLNLCEGGIGGHAHKGHLHSDETKRKISEAAKGRKRQPFSEEWKNKISLAVSGPNNGMYGKRGINNPNYGSHRSDEAKRKMSEAAKRRKHTPHSEETKRKISEAAKSRKQRNSILNKNTD